MQQQNCHALMICIVLAGARSPENEHFGASNNENETQEKERMSQDLLSPKSGYFIARLPPIGLFHRKGLMREISRESA